MDHINDLPPELLVQIFFQFIKSEGRESFLKNVSPSCKYWTDLSSSGELWKDVSVNYFEVKDLQDLLELGKQGLLVPTRCLRINEDICIQNPLVLFDLTRVYIHCPNLRELNLYNIKLSPVSLNNMKPFCPYLESLTFSGIIFDGEGMPNDPQHPTDLLIPVVSACGRNLKHLTVKNINAFGVYFMVQPLAHGLVSKIAQCCPSLQKLVFSNHCGHFRYPFPLLEVGTSCHKLRVLKVSCCNMPKYESCRTSMFVQLKTFEALFCHFDDENIGTIFKNSENLEKLKMVHCNDISLSDMSSIPSDRLEILEFDDRSFQRLKFLEDAVAKWQHTLKDIRLHRLKRDVTSVLQSLLRGNRGNPHPVMESLCLNHTAVENSALVQFIRASGNLKHLRFEPYGTRGHVPLPPHDYSYHTYQPEFPVEELGVSCQRLRTLKLSSCEMVFSSLKKNYEFRGMESFEVATCDFHGMDLNMLLSCSADLKMLSIFDCKNLILSGMSMIPSEKLKILRIENMDLGSDLKFLEDAVGKWKGSLKEIRLCELGQDVTGVLKSFLYENPHPVLEQLLLDFTLVSTSIMMALVQKCKKLNSVHFMPYGLYGRKGENFPEWFENRKEVEKIMKIRSTKARPTYEH